MKKILFISLFICTNYFSQVLLSYPENQTFYKGGYEKFYKDAHNFLIKNNVTPCENKSEAYNMKILVNEDGKVNYVKDPDDLALTNNKCTFDLAKRILTNLEDYSPAEFEGKKVAALTTIIFYPNELFASENYLPNNNLLVDPEFPGGITNYRKKFISCFDTNGFNYSKSFRFIINFEVNTKGEIQNIFIDTTFDNDKFVKMIVDCVVPRKLKFKPGTYNGTSITMKFKLPVSINVD